MADQQGGTSDIRWIRAVLDQYEGRLTRYAARMTGDVERARDAVQETFLRLASQPRASVDGHLAAWLYRVCRQRALDVRRKERRMSLFTDGEASQCESAAAEPGLALEQAESTAELVRALGRLPENQQEVIRLKFQEGLKYREIGQVTGLSTSHVGLLIHTALKTLREQLHPQQAAAPSE
jgi:RNA polymerase sigma factor (sigma-70 family)